MSSPNDPCANSSSPGGELDDLRLAALGLAELRHELHDPVRERQHPLVVGGDHDDPLPRREVAQQAQHLLDLDVVEVRGRLVGEQQRRVERERPGDRDPLLLAAGHVARAVVHALGEPDLLEQLGRPRPALLPRRPSRRAAAPRRSPAR